MARTQLLDGLRRWLEGVETLKALLQEADAAERFLAESEGKRQALADEVGRLQQRKEHIDTEIGAYRTLEFAKVEAKVTDARGRGEAELKAIRQDAIQERKAQLDARHRLDAILKRLERDLADAQREHANALGALRTERAEFSAQLSAGIADLERQRDGLESEVAVRRKEYTDITDRLAALARR